MSETIEEILERLRAKANGPGVQKPDAGARPLPDFMPSQTDAPKEDVLARNVRQLTPEQIASAVHVIAPAQISHVAEIFANKVANALNMRAIAPRIRQIAEQSLREALGDAKKMGGKK
ncbi:MAG: hypothetical protein FWG18_03565 [Alphaproteobacteria bacterium]|nr:hypothetical protein [Alphaproteobacteria bacterium]